MTLSERLQNIAKLDDSSAGDSAGRDAIEEVKGYEGVCFYCNLCRSHVDQSKMADHTKDARHKELAASLKDKETIEDKMVLCKSDLLSPTEEEFVAVKDIVLSCEKALKLVSDHILHCDDSKLETTDVSGCDVVKIEGEEKDQSMEGNENLEEKTESIVPPAPVRVIKGVMRAGLLANGLLMKGETDVRLVLLAVEKPTFELLTRVADDLPEQLAAVSENKYDIQVRSNDACIIVTASKEPRATCKISLTSTAIRLHPFNYYNEIAPVDPDSMLSREKCEEALQALRRARWFEAKVYALPYCEQVMRVMRDLCHRVPTWTVLNLWTLELLIHKCLSTADSSNLSPGVAVQRVFECIAGGALLPDSPGLYDPCEREPTDLCSRLSDQEREDITSSAQHALRLIAFQQIHTIFELSIDILTSDKDGKLGNKRKRTGSQSDTTECATEEKKEKK